LGGDSPNEAFGNIQDIEPFWTLSYADEPLSWGDEEHINECMLNYYKD